MDIPLSLLGLLLCCLELAAALNVTLDNTSPQVVFSPTPCFQQDVADCSTEWQFAESADAFNGSFTTTTGPDPSLGLDVLPRVSLTFQGTSVIFMPGLHSTALASVIVDDLVSVLFNTSQDAFSGVGLDPAQNHTITITFVPSDDLTTLDVDYFFVTQPDNNGTSPSTSSFFPTPLPTSLPPTSTPPSLSSPTSSPVPASSPTPTISGTLSQPTGVPTGTIAAVSLSAALLLLLALLTCLYTARRRRRRAAIQREKAILCDLRLPSEHVRGWERERMDVKDGAGMKDQDVTDERDRQWKERHWGEVDPGREKGKGRETNWRESVLPPVHYTPWR